MEKWNRQLRLLEQFEVLIITFNYLTDSVDISKKFSFSFTLWQHPKECKEIFWWKQISFEMTLKFLEKYDYVSKPGFQRCLSPRPSMSINITTCSFLTSSCQKEKGKKCIQFQTQQCTKISRNSTTKFKQESCVSSSSVE